MKNIIKSILNTSDIDKIEVIEELLSTCTSLTDSELEYFDYIIKSFNDLGQTPTIGVLLQKFPELETQLSSAKELSLDDLSYSIKKLVNDRKNKLASLHIMNLASQLTNKGLTENDIESLRDYLPDTVDGINEHVYDFTYFKDKYIKDKEKPTGLITGISQIDDIIGGCNISTVSTILAYTSQFKSTLAANMAYINSYHLGYNIAVISLEMPREDYLYNILGRHSNDMKFSKYPYISHGRIRRHSLTDEEEDYLLNEVLDDFNKNKKGMLFVLDETDFKNMSYTEIRETLYRVDDICLEQTGTPLDAIIIDHIHLMKFTDNANSRGKTEFSIINDYVSFFRRLTLKFRKTEEKDENGNTIYRQLATILLAQANRQGYDNACKKNGQYSMTAIAEANEIERASYRAIALWTSDELKLAKEVLVSVLKNRGGATMFDPISVYADGEAYVIGDFDGNITQSEGVDLGESLSIDDFSDLLGDDLGLI